MFVYTEDEATAIETASVLPGFESSPRDRIYPTGSGR